MKERTLADGRRFVAEEVDPDKFSCKLCDLYQDEGCLEIDDCEDLEAAILKEVK